MASPDVTLILIRHGLTDWNEQGRLLGRTHVPLNASGRAQAEAVAHALRDENVQAVLASPLRRAQETAEPIARRLGLTVETECDLDEVWLGRWAGKTWQEIYDDPDARCFVNDALHVSDAFEPAARIRERVLRLAERLQHTHPGHTLVLVSHGDPLRVLVSHYLSMPLGSYRSLQIANGSISRLRLRDDGAQLQLLNWRPPPHAT